MDEARKRPDIWGRRRGQSCQPTGLPYCAVAARKAAPSAASGGTQDARSSARTAPRRPRTCRGLCLHVKLGIDDSARTMLAINGAEGKRLTVEKVSPGLYRLAAAEPSEFETLAMVASAIPGAIVCLLSALNLHGIGTQAPHEVWLALDRKARKPTRLPARVGIVRFSGAALSYGIETRSILGVPVRVTSPARTIVDSFRYRRTLDRRCPRSAARRDPSAQGHGGRDHARG